MSDPPDYSRYSLDELEDARRHLDAGRHPERSVVLDREIARRLAGPAAAARPSPDPPPHSPEGLVRGIGVLQACVGGLAVLGTSLSLVLEPPHVLAAVFPNRSSSPVGIGILMALACMAILGGILLWRRQTRGIWWSLVFWGLQVPGFGLLGLHYLVLCGPGLIVYLRDGAPGLHLNMGTRLTLLWATPLDSWFLGFNAIALGCFALLYNHRFGFVNIKKIVDVFS